MPSLLNLLIYESLHARSVLEDHADEGELIYGVVAGAEELEVSADHSASPAEGSHCDG